TRPRTSRWLRSSDPRSYRRAWRWSGPCSRGRPLEGAVGPASGPLRRREPNESVASLTSFWLLDSVEGPPEAPPSAPSSTYCSSFGFLRCPLGTAWSSDSCHWRQLQRLTVSAVPGWNLLAGPRYAHLVPARRSLVAASARFSERRPL